MKSGKKYVSVSLVTSHQTLSYFSPSVNTQFSVPIFKYVI
jgi:hypothetical protein